MQCLLWRAFMTGKKRIPLIECGSSKGLLKRDGRHVTTGELFTCDCVGQFSLPRNNKVMRAKLLRGQNDVSINSECGYTMKLRQLSYELFQRE